MKKLIPVVIALTFLMSTIVYADEDVTITNAGSSLQNSSSASLSVQAQANSLKASTFTITFDSNGGSSVPSQTVGYGSYLMEPEDPHKEKYQFLGWFTPDGVEWDFLNPVLEEFTLTAHWALKASDTVTITYVSGDKNGGTKWGGTKYTRTSTQKEGNKIKSIPKPAFTKKLTFLYYTPYETSNFLDTTMPAYDESELVWNDLVLYAIYQEEDNSAKFSKVKFKANGGYFGDNKDDTSKTTEVRNGSAVAKPEDPKRDDYEFKGWYYNENNNDSDKYDFADPVDSETTLYAHWKEKDVKKGEATNYNPYKSSSSMALTPEQLLKLQAQQLQAQQAAQTAAAIAAGKAGSVSGAKVPKTGVGFSPMLIILLILLVGITAVLIYRRSKNGKKDV